MSEMARENDLVIKQNEYSYILDTTKSNIIVACGPLKLSLSSSDRIVTLDPDTNRFVPASQDNAIKSFVSAEADCYTIIRNPAKNNEHPKISCSCSTPEIEWGKSIIVHGVQNFALFPGQYAEVIKGHSLRTNQYLVVRVTDAEELTDGKHYNGEQFIVKGTETKFYRPVTGLTIEKDENGNFIRQAVSIEQMEYVILRKDNGERRFMRGPAVIYPETDETLVTNPETGDVIFRCIELSPLSGIYIKVVAPYDEIIDGDGTIEEIDEIVTVEGETEEDDVVRKINKPAQLIHHEAGEELFITGKDGNKIYMPRPEHQIITYAGSKSILHHAIAIPEGEGRYILNRETASVKTIMGPVMKLLDPRYEVMVTRKLTKKECELWYPGNKEVLAYNCPKETSTVCLDSLNDYTKEYNNIINNYVTTSALNISPSLTGTITTTLDTLNNGFIGQNTAVIDKKSGISRGNKYTKPRTISFDDTKYDGLVNIDVWTGYAVHVVDKSGSSRVEIGPKTVMLEYTETLECIDSNTVYLKVCNNQVRDKISVQTKDYVNVDVDVVYNVNFELSHKDKWFSIENYKQYLIDNTRSLIKKEAKKYTVEEFYGSATDIISKVILESDAKSKKSVIFSNGMCISDVEILAVDITDSAVRELLHKHQQEIVEKTLRLSSTNKEMNVITELAKLEREKVDIQYKNKLYELELNSKLKQEEQKSADEYRKLVEATHKAEREHEKEMQTLKAAIEKIELAAAKEKMNSELAVAKEKDKIEIDREKARTDALKKVVESISPDLISAIQSASDNDMLRSVSENIAPWALASNESVSDVVNKLLRGTSLEGLIDKVVDIKKKD